jgi:hypothetical protein
MSFYACEEKACLLWRQGLDHLRNVLRRFGELGDVLNHEPSLACAVQCDPKDGTRVSNRARAGAGLSVVRA